MKIENLRLSLLAAAALFVVADVAAMQEPDLLVPAPAEVLPVYEEGVNTKKRSRSGSPVFQQEKQEEHDKEDEEEYEEDPMERLVALEYYAAEQSEYIDELYNKVAEVKARSTSKNALAVLKRQNDKLREEVAACMSILTSDERNVRRTSDRFAAQDENLNELQKVVKDFEVRAKKSELDLQKVINSNPALTKRVDVLSQQVEALKKQRAALQQELADLKESGSEHQSEIVLLKAAMREQTNVLNDIKAQAELGRKWFWSRWTAKTEKKA